MKDKRTSTERNEPVYYPQQSIGLTRRELFAAMAMQGFAADPSNNEDWNSYVASGGMAAAAVGWADSLIAELDK